MSAGAFLCLASMACASGSTPARTVAPTSEPLPETRGFAGGLQVQGGFTNQASAVFDSVVAAPRSAVWAAMPGVFESLELETPTLESATYTIGDPGSRVSRIAGSRRLSQYLDCGAGIRGANADNYEVTLQLLVRLATGTEGTVVRTTLDAYARPRDSAGEPIHCASEGTLERRVLTLISEGLARAELAAAGESEVGAPGTAGTLSAMSAGRIPVVGDVLRIECHASGFGEPPVGQGRYVGAGGGALRLTVDSRGQTVAVPAVHVRVVQVRERRSYAVVGTVLGFVAGATLGGLYGSSRYDPDATYHFRPAVVTAVGVVAGGLGGGLLGRLGGSLIRSDAWHEAPPEWALRTSGADPLLVSTSSAARCPGL
ncbi:MAG: hypothetical protein PVJ80_07120 [Gemmatimonadota bacterium]